MAKSRAGKSFLATLYAARQKADEGIAPTDDAFREQFPGLWELMTDCWIDAKRKTDAGQIQIWNSSGDWAFKATSTGLKASKTVMVRTMAEGFAKLEKALFDDQVPWQFWLKRSAAIRKRKDGKNGLASDDES
jgi:hypothetical protein